MPDFDSGILILIQQVSARQTLARKRILGIELDSMLKLLLRLLEPVLPEVKPS